MCDIAFAKGAFDPDACPVLAGLDAEARRTLLDTDEHLRACIEAAIAARSGRGTATDAVCPTACPTA